MVSAMLRAGAARCGSLAGGQTREEGGPRAGLCGGEAGGTRVGPAPPYSGEREKEAGVAAETG